MKLPGFDELLLAKKSLREEVGGRRARIRQAAQHVWSAMFYWDQWPQSLQAGADAIKPLLFRYGTIAMTVSQMSDEEIDELGRELADLIKTAEEARA